MTKAGKDVERENPLSAVGGNVNWYSLKELRLELPSDSGISLLWACTHNSVSDHRDACMAMCTVVLFIRAGRGKEPRCTSTGE